MAEIPLTELERELLELCSMDVGGGESTTTLDEEMLEVTPGRSVIESTLRGLVARGLMRTFRGSYSGLQQHRDGSKVHRAYEDDWWPLTEEGRAAIGLGPPVKPERLPPSVEAPDWLSAAVTAVLGDMQMPMPYVLKAKWGPPRDRDEWGCAVLIHPDDTCVVEVPEVPRQGRETDLLLAIAEQLPSFVSEQRETWGQPRPACPGHTHPALVVEREGEAWWMCPATGRPLARVGSLASSADTPPQQP